MEPPVDVPPESPPPEPRPAAEAAPDRHRCARCGAPHDPYQEYCLECGARLVALRPQGFSIWRRETWTRDSPMWFWATFLALLLIALIAGAIVLAATRDDDGEARAPTPGPGTSQLLPTQITTGALTTTGFETTMTTFPTLTTDTTATTATTVTTATATTGTTATDTTTSGTVVSWPSGQSGYTVILASVPKARGRPAAVAQAERAIDAGLDEVGVLDSGQYDSLTAGYWVVFTGIHDTESQARNALPAARQSGYPVAYIREITP